MFILLRYGIAEIVNGRDSMEDRTIAKASIEEEAKRQKERALSGAIPTSSFHVDVYLLACLLTYLTILYFNILF